MKKLLLLTTLSLSFVLASCGTAEDVVPKESIAEKSSATITIVSDKEIIAEKEVEFEDGDVLQDVMKDNFSIVEESGFVTSIEDLKQSEEENKWWVFTTNGEMATVGADEFTLDDEDDIEWELTKF